MVVHSCSSQEENCISLMTLHYKVAGYETGVLGCGSRMSSTLKPTVSIIVSSTILNWAFDLT